MPSPNQVLIFTLALAGVCSVAAVYAAVKWLGARNKKMGRALQEFASGSGFDFFDVLIYSGDDQKAVHLMEAAEKTRLLYKELEFPKGVRLYNRGRPQERMARYVLRRKTSGTLLFVFEYDYMDEIETSRFQTVCHFQSERLSLPEFDTGTKLPPSLPSYLENHPGLCIEGCRNVLIVYRHDKVAPAGELASLIKEASEIFDLVKS